MKKNYAVRVSEEVHQKLKDLGSQSVIKYLNDFANKHIKCNKCLAVVKMDITKTKCGNCDNEI